MENGRSKFVKSCRNGSLVFARENQSFFSWTMRTKWWTLPSHRHQLGNWISHMSVNMHTGMGNARRWNPLSIDPAASRFSNYAAFNGEAITRPFAPEIPIDAELIDAHTRLRRQILSRFYP